MVQSKKKKGEIPLSKFKQKNGVAGIYVAASETVVGPAVAQVTSSVFETSMQGVQRVELVQKDF